MDRSQKYPWGGGDAVLRTSDRTENVEARHTHHPQWTITPPTKQQSNQQTMARTIHWTGVHCMNPEALTTPEEYGTPNPRGVTKGAWRWGGVAGWGRSSPTRNYPTPVGFIAWEAVGSQYRKCRSDRNSRSPSAVQHVHTRAQARHTAQWKGGRLKVDLHTVWEARALVSPPTALSLLSTGPQCGTRSRPQGCGPQQQRCASQREEKEWHCQFRQCPEV